MNSKFYIARILTQQKSSIIRFHPSPGGSDNKESACDTGDEGSISVLERSPKEGNGNHSSIPGEFHGQRSLVGYISWGRKESDKTELLNTYHMADSHCCWNLINLDSLFGKSNVRHKDVD